MTISYAGIVGGPAVSLLVVAISAAVRGPETLMRVPMAWETLVPIGAMTRTATVSLAVPWRSIPVQGRPVGTSQSLTLAMSAA